MFDLKWIRDNPDAFDAGLKRRGVDALSSRILDIDSRRRGAQTRFQEQQQRRNDLSRQIGYDERLHKSERQDLFQDDIKERP